MKGPNPRDRRRLKTPAGQQVEVLSGAPLAPEVDSPTVEEVMRSLDRMPDVTSWPAIARMVMPVFPRAGRSAVDEYDGQPLTMQLPPGVTVGFALDIGNAFAVVTRSMVTRWERHPGTVVTQAIANLRRRAAEVTSDYVIEESSADGSVTKAFQPPGAWGSTLLLVPDELERIFGREPQVFIAPMRSLLVSFAAHVGIETVTFFAEEFESLDPNALRLEAFMLRDGRLSILPLPRSERGVVGSYTS